PSGALSEGVHMQHTRTSWLRAGLAAGSVLPLLAVAIASSAGAAAADDTRERGSSSAGALAAGPTAIADGTATDLAAALATDSADVTGASFVATPPEGAPTGVGDSTLAGFPRDGGTFSILSSGNVSEV